MRRLWPALIISLTLIAVLGGCGGDDEDGGAQSDKAATSAAADAPEGAAEPRAAIQEYFEAKRLGQAETICGYESDAYQTLQYDSPGQACLDEPANNQPQPVWAEKVKIVSLKESGETATATIEPNAGSPARAQIALSLKDGAWIVDALQ